MAGRQYTQAVTVRREFGSLHLPGPRRQADPGPDPPAGPPGGPARRLLRRAGAHRIADALAAFPRSRRPTTGSGATPTPGSRATIPRGRVADHRGRAHPRPHAGPLRLRRPGCGAAVRRRPRAAHDHPVDRLRAGRRRRCRSATSWLRWPRCAPCPTSPCCPRTDRWPRRSHARVDELTAHHAHRLRLCRDAVADGGRTAYATAQALPWTRHALRFDDLDLFNAAMATMETRAHLELLVARGELALEDGDEGAVSDAGRPALISCRGAPSAGGRRRRR